MANLGFSGPAWIDYLTVEFNKTELLTYNLAYGRFFSTKLSEQLAR